jgi:FlaA1/EpsC-like NDP-sugar epimerase
MFSKLNQFSKQIIVFFVDAALIVSSLFLSYTLRFNTLDNSAHIHEILAILPVILLMRLGVFITMGLYRGMWRYTSMHDLVTIIKAVTLSSGLSMALLFLIYRLADYPRSVFVIDWFVILVLIGGSRFAYRLYHDGWNKRDSDIRIIAKNVLIVGAGRGGEMILREILSNSRLNYAPIGFVDDDRKKRNMTIHGYRVLGNTRDIPTIVDDYNVKEVFLAIPTASGAAKRRIMLTCKSSGVKSKTLPGVGELLRGTAKVSSLREFQIEDLLGREPAKLDSALIKEYLRDKTVMITGAGGSIGSELCRQVAQFSPKRLILFERSEFNLYQIHMNIIELFPALKINAIIGDLLNQNRVEQTLAKFMPEVVFHAAAYKHVPLMEMNPIEALQNNIKGTSILAHCAHVYGVRKFVMVSTDKAVRPTNIMGVSKRIAELICQSVGNNSKTQFVTVRFGNVLNSVGSVIPLFKYQIEKGGPITVTHPEIYRYFMTIPESVQLIMQAGAMGKGGEVFILDMGEPVKIVDLARDMISLSGLEPDKDIKIMYTGLRPGEKLYEELLTAGEEIKSTLHEKIKIAGSECIDWTVVMNNVETLLESLQEGFSRDVLQKIKDIVPEFQPENGGPSSPMQSFRNYSYEVSRVKEERSTNIAPIDKLDIRPDDVIEPTL